MIIGSPRPGTPLDRNNPLASGVTAAFLFSRGTGTYVEDSAYGMGLTLFGSPEWGSAVTDLNRPAYMGVKFNGTTQYCKTEAYSPRTNGVGGLTVRLRFTYGGHNGLGNNTLWMASKFGSNLWDWGVGVRSRTGSNTADDHAPIYYTDSNGGVLDFQANFADMVIGQDYTLHWVHDTVASQISCYRDGVLGGTQACPGPTDTAQIALAVGRTENFNDGEMTGDISSLVLWNRPLSAGDVAKDFAKPWDLWVQDKPISRKYFVLGPTGAPALSWLSVYPSIMAARQAAPAHRESSMPVAPIAAASVPALSWGPELPDLPPLAQRSVAIGGSTHLTSLANLSVPGLPWIPKHHDRLEPPARLPAEGYSVTVPQLPALPVPNLSWGAKYPDRLDRSRRREDGCIVSEPGLSALPVPPLGWAGVYPDRVDIARRPVNDGGTPTSLPSPPAAATPSLSWQAGFPDRIDRAARNPDGMSVGLPWLSAFPVPPLSWLGVYPDGAARAPGRPVLEGGMVGQPGISAYPIPLLSWLGVFPDGAARMAGRAAEGFAAQFISQAGSSLTPMAWLSRYPDFPARGPQRPVAEGGPVGLVSLAAFPVPPLSWLGIFPDGAARRAPSVAETFSAWVAGLANLAIPALSWAPRFVDPTWRPKLHQTQDFGAPVLPPGAPPAVPALSWGPAYPDVIFRTALREATWSIASALPPPPPTLSWGPGYPSILLRAQGAREGWRSDSLVQPFPPGLSFLPNFPGPVYPPKLREATWQASPVAPVAQDSPPLAWAPVIPDPVRAGRVAQSFSAVPIAPPAIFLPMWDPHYPSILRAVPIHPMQHWTTRLDPPPPATPADRLGWEPKCPSFIWSSPNPMRYAVGGPVLVFIVAPTGELHAVLVEVGEWHAKLRT